MTLNVYFLPMPRVLIVAFPEAQTLDVTGPAEVFAAANRELGRQHYRVVLTSRRDGPLSTSSGLALHAQALDRTRPLAGDLVIVAGGEENAVERALETGDYVDWVKRASRRVSRLASVCTGAFLLAAAGVLDGKRAATHWQSCERLQQFRPQVSVDPNAIFVEHEGVWTSAGVTTGIDMALAMVERDHDARLADAVAARLVLYVRRLGFQSQFSAALLAQSDRSTPLADVIAWARAHLSEVDVNALSHRAGMSPRTFHRRCQSCLRTTPARLLEKLRVEQARTLLCTTVLPLKVVAADCGFGSPVRMHRAFLRELGTSPRACRLLFAARNEETLNGISIS